MVSKKYTYYKELCLAKKAVKSAYTKVILKNPMDVKVKGKQDLVTNLDVMCEQYLIDAIKTRYPNDTIISEENNPTNIPKQRSWAIDPIDGTLNFAFNIGLWGIQLAFMVDNKPEFCVMYLPTLNEFYYAVIGQGAYLNEKPMPKVVSQPASEHMAMVDYISAATPAAIQDFDILSKTTLKARAIGSACFSYTQVASGKYGSFILYCDNIWDYLPGSILCHECGVPVYYKTCKDPKVRVTLATFNPEVKKALKYTKTLF